MEGKLIKLRAPTISDIDLYYRWRNDKEVAYWATGNDHWFTEVSVEQLKHIFEKNITNPERKKSFDVYTITTLNDEPIGFADYRDIDYVSRSVTIGLTIGEKEYWNKGYGTDAIQSFVQFFFQRRNLHRVQADTWSGNERSIRAFQKCGFQIEGRLRDSYWVEGKYYDTVVMGLLRSEWKQ